MWWFFQHLCWQSSFFNSPLTRFQPIVFTNRFTNCRSPLVWTPIRSAYKWLITCIWAISTTLLFLCQAKTVMTWNYKYISKSFLMFPADVLWNLSNHQLWINFTCFLRLTSDLTEMRQRVLNLTYGSGHRCRIHIEHNT